MNFPSEELVVCGVECGERVMQDRLITKDFSVDYPAPSRLQNYDADYWLKRARQTREKALTFGDRRLHDRLIKVALEYERLAVRDMR